ncbi:hypothetical protein CDAR_165671 [Caerostris darwini]|uniref:Uncharacterized protein n=1 Tax=Caerostris darwini TaxID=1538125 RepID=A0AAV4WC90_9ARAC|nr:hypothetical protein CDAR_165671 [Caerostris darwini]
MLKRYRVDPNEATNHALVHGDNRKLKIFPKTHTLNVSATIYVSGHKHDTCFIVDEWIPSAQVYFWKGDRQINFRILQIKIDTGMLEMSLGAVCFSVFFVFVLCVLVQSICNIRRKLIS